MKHLVLLIVALALLPGAVLTAQQGDARPGPPADPTQPTVAQPADKAPASPQDFVPVSTLQQPEQLPAAPLLVGAYAFVWVALVVYIWSLWRRMTKIERELTDLRRRVETR